MVLEQTRLSTKIMGALKEEIESRSSTESAGLLIKALEYFGEFYSLDNGFIKQLNNQITRQYSQLALQEKLGYLKIYLSNPNQAFVQLAERIINDLYEKCQAMSLEILLVLNQALNKLAADKNINVAEKSSHIFSAISLQLEQLTTKKEYPDFTDLIVNEYLFNFIFHNQLNNDHFQQYFLVYSEKVFQAIVEGRMSEVHLLKLLENCYIYFAGQDAELISKVNSKDPR